MKRNRKMTRQTIDFILAYSQKLKEEMRNCDRGKKDITCDEGYITRTMLMGIYNVLINEGYPKKHLDNFFFFEGEPNKNKEWTEQACKFYFRNRRNFSKIVERFFNEDPAGIKLRKEIDKLFD